MPKLQEIPLVCEACGKPLSLVLCDGDVKVGIACMHCMGTYAVQGDDWNAVMNKWSEVHKERTGIPYA